MIEKHLTREKLLQDLLFFYAQGLFSKWDHLNNFSCFLLPRFFAKPWLNKFWCDESTFLHDFKKYTKKKPQNCTKNSFPKSSFYCSLLKCAWYYCEHFTSFNASTIHREKCYIYNHVHARKRRDERNVNCTLSFQQHSRFLCLFCTFFFKSQREHFWIISFMA